MGPNASWDRPNGISPREGWASPGPTVSEATRFFNSEDWRDVTGVSSSRAGPSEAKWPSGASPDS